MKKLIKLIIIFFLIGSVIIAIFIAGDKLSGTNNSQNIFDSVKTFLGLNTVEEVKEDNRPLVAFLNTETAELLESKATFVLTSNKPVTLEQNNRLNLVETGEKDSEDNFLYILEVSNIGVGEGRVNVTVKDNINQEQKLTVSTSRTPFTVPLEGDVLEPWPNSKYIPKGDDLLAPTNKTNRLTSTYAPKDLVNLKNNYVNLYINDATFVLRKEAADALDLMLAGLRKERNKNVVVASAYRSYTNQVTTYTGWLRQLGRKEADKISARPGYSEHQLGTAVDFFSEDSGFDFTAKFDSSIAGKWLLDNAHKYGYIQTYPKGSEKKTGYSYEAWHWRYIGVDNAEAMRKSGKIFADWIKEK